MKMRLHVHGLWGAAACGSLLAAAFGFIGRGTFEHRVLMTACAIAGALLLFLACILHVIARRNGVRSLQTVAYSTAVFGLLSVSQIEGRIVGALVHDRDVRAARGYGERVVARLEELRATTGHYPAALAEVLRDLPEPPHLFQRSTVFTSVRDEFILSFNEADAVIPHVVQYSSVSRRWARF